MPQMSPLMWLTLMLFFTSYMYLILTNSYFIFKYKFNFYNIKKKSISNLKLKW